MAMTDGQLRRRLKAIQKTAEHGMEDGYHNPKSGVPTSACHDVKFLLAHIDGLNLLIADLKARYANLKRLRSCI